MKARLSFIVLGIFLALQAGSAYALNVRSADIVDGEVKNVDLGADAVTSNKILDGTIGSNDLADLTVTNGKIGAGAVTDNKISGVITTTHLPVGTTTGTVAAGEHNHEGLYLKKYARVIVVAESGGDFSNPIDALASISNPSDSNPYLLKIMPGVYDIGTQTIQMMNFVEIQGSGTLTTVIKANPSLNGTVVRGADNVRLADLTIEHQNWTGILNDGVSPLIDNVRIITHANPSGNGANINTAIANRNSQAVVKNVSIISEGSVGSGYENVSVSNEGGEPRFENLTIDQSGASFGMNNIGTVTLENTTIRGASIGIQYSGELILRNSRIEAGTAITGGGMLRLDNSYISSVVGIECAGGPVYVNNSEFRRTEYPAFWPFTNNCTAFVNNSLIVDGTFTPGIFKCHNVFDAEYNTIDCP